MKEKAHVRSIIKCVTPRGLGPTAPPLLAGDGGGGGGVYFVEVDVVVRLGEAGVALGEETDVDVVVGLAEER